MCKAGQSKVAIRAETAVTGTHVHLHPEAETTLIRAVQESLANVQKHAQASSAQVTLSYMPDVLMLDVYDNGIGLDQASRPVKGGGYGLIAMRQRVSQVGGSLTIESEPNGGTTVVVQLPIQRMAQRQPDNKRRAMMSIRILLVDDHPVVRAGIEGILNSQDDINVVGEASNGEEAIRLSHTLQPDVILMELTDARNGRCIGNPDH